MTTLILPTWQELMLEMADKLDVPVIPGMYIDVRLQVLESGTYALHFGDACYDTDHNGYWGASILETGMGDNDLLAVAEDLIRQVEESFAQ